jgi:hypothetical protein
MRISTNTSLRQYLRILTVAKSEPKIDIQVKFKFRHWGIMWRFPETLQELKFYDFQVAQRFATMEQSVSMLVNIKNCNASKYRQLLMYKAIERMPIKKILPLILFYQKEYGNIAKWFEQQNELVTKGESLKYDLQEFGYSTVSFVLAKGDRQMAREFIDQQDTVYVMAEYRRELKNIENQNHQIEKLKHDSNTKNNI